MMAVVFLRTQEIYCLDLLSPFSSKECIVFAMICVCMTGVKPLADIV